MINTMLHSIATGNLLPARVRVAVIDMNPAAGTKLADRGSWHEARLTNRKSVRNRGSDMFFSKDIRSLAIVLGCALVTSGLLAACQESMDRVHTYSSQTAATTVSEGGSIQYCMEMTGVGDTCYVGPGDYYEDLTLVDGVIVEGAGPGLTILHGSVEFNGSIREDQPTVISGFTIIGTDPTNRGTAGIYVRHGNVNIFNNHVEGFWNGIRCGSEYWGEIRGNVLQQNGRGVSFSETVFTPVIADNLFIFNAELGIFLYTVNAPVIMHNTFVGNGFANTYDRHMGGGIVTYMVYDEVVVNNIFVSNNAGIERERGAAENYHHNLVWGNAVDYAETAVPGEGDINVDPLFVNAAQGDFRLRPGSPAIDMGSLALTSDADFDGTERPKGTGPDLGAFEFNTPEGPVQLVISEVLANPIDEDRGEFVEVYNASEVEFDLAGLYLTDGDTTDIVVAIDDDITTVASQSYAVIIDSEYVSGYDIPGGATVVTLGNTTVGNGLSTNDAITLYDRDGVTVLATYAHPFDPGNGVSAERLDLQGPDLETNWRSSPCTQSAGRPNCAPVTLASGLIITEVMSNPLDESTGEFIEIFNGTDEPVSVAGMQISDGDTIDNIIGWDEGGTLIAERTYAVILDPGRTEDEMVFVDPTAVLLTVADSAIGNGLAVSDPISLLSGTGEVIDTYSRTLAVGNGRSVEKVSLSIGDIEGNWAQSSCEFGSSPGYLNCVSSASSGPKAPLVITEVMTNAVDEDTGEFIEIYNRGIDPVDAAGLILSDGDAVDVIGAFDDGDTLIPGGDYALILDAEYAGEYDIPAGVTLLSTQDSTLGSSLSIEDPIRLLASNGVEVIDTFRYPFNPGNGVSAERIDVRGFDAADNWTASTCESGSSPGEHNCSASEAGLPKQLRITEVMANQLGTETDGAGEYIELLNTGERSIELSGMTVIVGAEGATARDDLVSFDGAETTLVPGAYALIVDRQYDDRYDIEPGTVVVTIDDNNFGSSGFATTHWTTLYDVDGITMLDRFRFPSDPGDGISLYRISLAAADSEANWEATPCGNTPGYPSCSGSTDVTSYTSFWIDQNASEGGIFWYQAIGWPAWRETVCEMTIVCPGGAYGYTYRDNFPAAVAFEFQNPYDSHSVVFEEREGPNHTCDPCGTDTFTVGPGETLEVPASSLGYYFAITQGPRLNSYDWFEGDPDRYWALPPDGILAPFSVEVPLP